MSVLTPNVLGVLLTSVYCSPCLACACWCHDCCLCLHDCTLQL